MLLGLAQAGAANAADGHGDDFIVALTAYEHDDFAACASVLERLHDDGVALPPGGELLEPECLAAGGHPERAFDVLERALASGPVDMPGLRGKDRPGLNLMRTLPRWPALLAQAERLQAAREAGIDPVLRSELLARAERDQQAQHAAIEAGNTPESWKQVVPVEQANTAWLKQVVARHGWPGASLVGADGATAAWVMVQHADADPAFQAQVLPMLEQAAAHGEVSRQDLALLTDRVLVAQGKPQRFGTQFVKGADGWMSMRATEDEAGLDARRRAMGLPALAEYKRMLAEAYHVQVR